MFIKGLVTGELNSHSYRIRKIMKQTHAENRKWGVDGGKICAIMELILILTDLKRGGFFVENLRFRGRTKGENGKS